MIGPRFGRRTVGVIVAPCLLLAGCVGQPAAVRTDQPGGRHTTQETVAVRRTGRHPADQQTSRPASPVLQSSQRPVIVIDPGHSGHAIRHRNKATGLIDFDYPNQPEMTEVFDISTCIAAGLRANGYRVILTKKTADSTVSLTRRAQIANRAHADLAISVHDDHSQTKRFQAVYSQLGIKHDGRYHAMWRGSGANRTVFNRPKIAEKSARYTRIIAQSRSKAQHRPVEITEENFTGRAGLEPGNLALVQLLAAVPWVYSESGAKRHGSTTTRLSIKAETAYAKGILDGIVASVPVSGAGSVNAAGSESRAAVRQCIVRHRNG